MTPPPAVDHTVGLNPAPRRRAAALAVAMVAWAIAMAWAIGVVTVSGADAATMPALTRPAAISAASAIPRPAASVASTAPPGPVEIDAAVTATAADLAAQKNRLAALQAQAAAQADGLAKTKAELALRAAGAAAALEAFATATRTADAAHMQEVAQRDRLLRAQLLLAQQREQLGHWVREAYRDGTGPVADSPTIMTILSAGPSDDLDTTLVILRRVGQVKSHSVSVYAAAQAERQAAANTAAAAATQAQQALAAAAGARHEADLAVAAQRAAVGAQTQILATSTDATATAQKTLAKAADAYAAAVAARDAAQSLPQQPGDSSHSGSLLGPVGDCPGRDVSGYENGRLPIDALCPLWGTAGHHLRADAAFAFNRMSQRYDAVFGQPICVTDSYRTYEQQVELYARKPNLAARPGTSNHGWGTAVDLCGGIESFGTAQHDWLVQNAPLFGWFHPSWAEPGGSRPEPWHFEYGG